MSAELDHLVVAAANLDEGAAWLEHHLGVELTPGGRHAAMGTRNRLLRLGPALYLELIAIDPEAPAPARARWFGLDDPRLRARIAERPRLIHWVARTNDIAIARAACPEPLGEILPMNRGDLEWLITVPEDGHLPGEGLVPSLIQWQTDEHPAARLPDAGCALMKLEGFHPEPAHIQGALDALGLTGTLALYRSEAGEPPALAAYIRTPAGLRDLS